MRAAKVRTYLRKTLAVAMASLLQDKFSGNELRISQSTDRLSAKALAGCDHLLLIVPERPNAALWRTIPDGARIKALLRRGKAKGNPGRVNAFEEQAANRRPCRPAKD